VALKWQLKSDEQLLDMRFCDLPLRIGGTALEGRVDRLYQELYESGIRHKPHVWLSEEWFTPDAVPGFAIPFYLAHPRLMRLERRQMLEVEGGADSECMRLMRHETGHALDNAFALHRRRGYRELFGPYTQPYPESYKPDPNSQNYVLNLNAWYAQAHPAEDFAETFAVWLTPKSEWQRQYRGWPAIRKLQYVNELMRQIAGTRPGNNRHKTVEGLSEVKLTLREHYRRKRRHYSIKWPAFYDRHLRRVFSQGVGDRSLPTAASFLLRNRVMLRNQVAEGTGVHHYAVDQVLKHMIDRCKVLKLRVATSDYEAKFRAVIMLTAQTMNVMQSGHHPIAL
jgi:hypothetical protein